MRRRSVSTVEKDIRRRRPILGTRIPLVSLIQLLAVSEHLSFRRAALALGVSQSSVSTRIRRLEEDLDILIFERHPRGVKLTDVGRAFIAEVGQGIDRLEHAVKIAGTLARGEKGSLRISLHMPPGVFLGNLFRCQARTYPSVEIEVMEHAAHEAVRLIREGRVDLAFIAGTHSIEDCHSRQFWSEMMVVGLPSNHVLVHRPKLTWEDVVEETFLLRIGGAGPQMRDHLAKRFAERGRTPNILRWDVGRETLFRMVAHGFGVVLTTETAASAGIPGIVFRTLDNEPDPVWFTAIWSPYNRSATLHNLLGLAAEMHRTWRGSRSPQPTGIRQGRNAMGWPPGRALPRSMTTGLARNSQHDHNVGE